MANNNEAFELSDEQLEMVAGGGSNNAPLVSNNIQISNQIVTAVAPTTNTIVNIGGELKAAQAGSTLKDWGLLSNLGVKF